jgi:hypothetical protein
MSGPTESDDAGWVQRRAGGSGDELGGDQPSATTRVASKRAVDEALEDADAAVTGEQAHVDGERPQSAVLAMRLIRRGSRRRINHDELEAATSGNADPIGRVGMRRRERDQPLADPIEPAGEHHRGQAVP